MTYWETVRVERDFPRSAMTGLPLFSDTVSSPMLTSNHMPMAVDKICSLWF